MKKLFPIIMIFLIIASCDSGEKSSPINIKGETQFISREKYADQLYGFWLGEYIANWTGLVTEMDKIGNIVETIKIGALTGWDSDNPTATWGGLLGFMLGKEGIEKAFGRKFSNKFNIHRTRINFSDNGIDSFENMAEKGVKIIDRVVTEEMGGQIDTLENLWIIPDKSGI
ncbi:MAG: hypothetical protein JW798_16320 [Prolixibacteraceae bacterium]|nr:hypothetical protein [Prolixibacteraceae bacterium]